MTGFLVGALLALLALGWWTRLRRRLRAERMDALVDGMRELGTILGEQGEPCEFLGSAGPMLQFRRGDERFALDANEVAGIMTEGTPARRRQRLVWLLERAKPGAPDEDIRRADP